MPLQNGNWISNVTWQLQNTTSNTSFNAPIQTGNVSTTFQGLNFTIWNQIYVANLAILPAASTTIDLTSLTNLVYENFSFARVISMYVLPTGSAITVGPGASNPLQWFFDSTSGYITIQNGGVFMFNNASTDTVGQVVNSGSKTLKFTNLTSLATAWSSSTNYVVGNTVSLSSNNYTCILNNINHNPTSSPTYWTLSGVAEVEVYIIGGTV